MSELPILVAGGLEATRATVESLLGARRYAQRSTRDGSVASLEEQLDDTLELVIVVLPADARGKDLLDALSNRPHVPPVIVVGRDASVTDATVAFELGAMDYVERVDDRTRLYESLGLALGTSRRDSELRFFRNRAAQAADWSGLIGKCDAMREVRRMVRQIVGRSSARTKPPILITGETGTGKGLLARCVHFSSARRNEPYVDVNCGALPPSLIEAELFGHERGAFTDARTSRPGLFETANGGTLFLDEIAALRLDLQSKLLTATEEKRVRRIGGRTYHDIDVQIIAATHRDLAKMVRDGEFREDLYHRLNVLSLHLPPLRARGVDKVLLAEKFVEQMCNEYALPVRDIAAEAQELIQSYAWPGNVRELKNQIERIILVADDYEVRAEHFEIRREMSMTIGGNDADPEVSLPETGISLEALERAIIRQALDMCQGNVSQTARFLRMSRQTLIYRLKKHEITPPSKTG